MPKGEAIEFYCEFASPYGYLASTQIQALAERHGRPLMATPVLLGPIFKQTGAIPLALMPLKGDYMAPDAHPFPPPPGPLPVGGRGIKVCGEASGSANFSW